MNALAQSVSVSLCPPRHVRYRRIDVRAWGIMKSGSFEAADPQLAPLLVRCGRGDRSAFRRLYDLQAPRLHGVALRITRQASLAADAVQEAFLQVWQNAARYDPARGSAEAWLVILVRYRALDLARRQGREQPGLTLPEAADLSPDALAQLVSHADARALRRCLEQLKEERRRLIVMSFIGGLTHAELSERLATPLGTVKSWIRRGLAALRDCLER